MKVIYTPLQKKIRLEYVFLVGRVASESLAVGDGRIDGFQFTG